MLSNTINYDSLYRVYKNSIHINHLNIHKKFALQFYSRKDVWLLGFEKNCYRILSAQLSK